VDALRSVGDWPGTEAAVAVIGPAGILAERGDFRRISYWASITKLLTAYACLIAVEEGVVDLDEPAGPSGSTLRHLLAHASGLPFEDGPPIARPGTRRIYSNPGLEVAAELVTARAEMPFAEYQRLAVLETLGMGAELRGSPAFAMHGTLRDLCAFASELLAPRLLAPETLDEATTVAFAGLAGVVPGFGRYDPCDWGLGFELRDDKAPHWTGERNSPRTFGHFGASGTFLWVDPEARLACACLAGREFGGWAREAWPPLADAVLAEYA
jgi:CubicO group peptidase (beta-lactamase class C family)